MIVLHHFLRLCPNHSVHYIHRVRALLGDSDPGVVALVLQYLLDLIKVLALVLLILYVYPFSLLHCKYNMTFYPMCICVNLSFLGTQ